MVERDIENRFDCDLGGIDNLPWEINFRRAVDNCLCSVENTMVNVGERSAFNRAFLDGGTPILELSGVRDRVIGDLSPLRTALAKVDKTNIGTQDIQVLPYLRPSEKQVAIDELSKGGDKVIDEIKKTSYIAVPGIPGLILVSMLEEREGGHQVEMFYLRGFDLIPSRILNKLGLVGVDE